MKDCFSVVFTIIITIVVGSFMYSSFGPKGVIFMLIMGVVFGLMEGGKKN